MNNAGSQNNLNQLLLILPNEVLAPILLDIINGNRENAYLIIYVNLRYHQLMGPTYYEILTMDEVEVGHLTTLLQQHQGILRADGSLVRVIRLPQQHGQQTLEMDQTRTLLETFFVNLRVIDFNINNNPQPYTSALTRNGTPLGNIGPLEEIMLPNTINYEQYQLYFMACFFYRRTIISISIRYVENPHKNLNGLGIRLINYYITAFTGLTGVSLINDDGNAGISNRQVLIDVMNNLRNSPNVTTIRFTSQFDITDIDAQISLNNIRNQPLPNMNVNLTTLELNVRNFPSAYIEYLIQFTPQNFQSFALFINGQSFAKWINATDIDLTLGLATHIVSVRFAINKMFSNEFVLPGQPIVMEHLWSFLNQLADIREEATRITLPFLPFLNNLQNGSLQINASAETDNHLDVDYAPCLEQQNYSIDQNGLLQPQAYDYQYYYLRN